MASSSSKHCRLCSIGLHLSSMKTLVVMVRLKSSLKCEANFKVKFESFIHGWLRSGLRKHHASGEKYLAINLMKNAKYYTSDLYSVDKHCRVAQVRGEREFPFPVIPGNTSLKFPVPSVPVAFCYFPSGPGKKEVSAGN